jgi:hypothetical protein
MNKTGKYLGFIYTAGCFAYAGYEWYSYTGLYRLAAEWQTSTFGSYSINGTFLLSLFAVWLPGAMLAKRFGLGSDESLSMELASSPRLRLVAGLALVALAAGAGWYGYGKATADVAFEAFDLSNSKTPPSDHVVMTGVAHAEYLVDFQTRSGGSVYLDRYVPITSTEWRSGDPLVYFLRDRASVDAEDGRLLFMTLKKSKFFEILRSTPPFPMTTPPGVLIDNDLPGPVAEVYRKDNVAVAPAPVVLDFDTSADVDPYFITAGVSGVVGIYCLVTAAMMAFRRRRLAQT